MSTIKELAALLKESMEQMNTNFNQLEKQLESKLAENTQRITTEVNQTITEKIEDIYSDLGKRISELQLNQEHSAKQLSEELTQMKQNVHDLKENVDEQIKTKVDVKDLDTLKEELHSFKQQTVNDLYQCKLISNDACNKYLLVHEKQEKILKKLESRNNTVETVLDPVNPISSGRISSNEVSNDVSNRLQLSENRDEGVVIQDTVYANGANNNIRLSDIKNLECFDGSVESKLPVTYLNEIIEDLKILGVHPSQYLNVFKILLVGSARIWYSTHAKYFRTFDDFVDRFITHYQSDAIRVHRLAQVFTKRYSPQEGSVLTFFWKKVEEFQNLSPHLTHNEIISSIISVLPYRYRSYLVGRLFHTLEEFADVLIDIEAYLPDTYNRNASAYNSDYPRVPSRTHQLRHQDKRSVSQVNCNFDDDRPNSPRQRQNLRYNRSNNFQRSNRTTFSRDNRANFYRNVPYQRNAVDGYRRSYDQRTPSYNNQRRVYHSDETDSNPRQREIDNEMPSTSGSTHNISQVHVNNDQMNQLPRSNQNTSPPRNEHRINFIYMDLLNEIGREDVTFPEKDEAAIVLNKPDMNLPKKKWAEEYKKK